MRNFVQLILIALLLGYSPIFYTMAADQGGVQTQGKKLETTSKKQDKEAPKKDSKGQDLSTLKKDEANKKGKVKMVEIKTNLGRIVVSLDSEKAPATVENFLQYVKDKFYDGTIFHRVISNFMIQGGGVDTKMKEKATRKPIKNEAANGLKNDRGTIAMARTMAPHSASAQFFINVKDNGFLNHRSTRDDEFGYAVFGKVTEGMDVVDKIKDVPTGPNDVPKTQVVIESIRAL